MNIADRSGSALKRQSLHQELAEKLRELIVTGELRPGSKVPEKDLCDYFGVSRTPLREALKVLAADRLVSLQPNRGAWVTRITIEDLEEVFPVMGALEALAGELACAKIDDAEIAAIRALHEEMVAAYERGALDTYFALNQRIHEAILAAARNETLTAQYQGLASRVRQARYMANMSRTRWQQAIDEHEEMLRHIEARDGAALSGVLRRHLDHKMETVRDWIEAARDGPETGGAG